MESGPVSDNVAVEWLQAKGSWLVYTLVLLVAKFILSFVFPIHSWTVLNVGHSIVTFFAFHWVKGSPFTTFWYTESDGHEADDHTMWEQVDRRWQGTPSRKFCTVVVIVLFAMAVETTPSGEWVVMCVNVVASAVVFIAKLPIMDEVRIFGINK